VRPSYSKLGMVAMDGKRPSSATVIASAALVVACWGVFVGPAWSGDTKTIPVVSTAGDCTTSFCAVIGKNVVVTSDIAPAAVTTSDMKVGSVSSSIIRADAVTTSDIDEEAVTASSLAPEAVTTSRLAPEAVTTSKIEPLAVTSSVINPGAVTFGKLALDAVHASNIEDGAVTRADLDTTPATTVVRTTTPQTICSGIPVPVTYESEIYDFGSMSNLGTNNDRITIPTSGVYTFEASVTFEGDAAGSRVIFLRAGNDDIAAASQSGTGADQELVMSRTLYVPAGTNITIHALTVGNNGPTCNSIFKELDITKARLSAQWMNNLTLGP
jgi:hypothetical protein